MTNYLPHEHFPASRSTLSCEAMRRAAGCPEDQIKHMSPGLETPWTEHQGVKIRILTAENAKVLWNNHHTNTPMRVIARCPQCGKIVPASRINQHGKVHDDGR